MPEMKIKETTLCYIENDKGEYLMLHRNKKKNDENEDKWIGVGGKLEEGETAQQAQDRANRANGVAPGTTVQPSQDEDDDERRRSNGGYHPALRAYDAVHDTAENAVRLNESGNGTNASHESSDGHNHHQQRLP